MTSIHPFYARNEKVYFISLKILTYYLADTLRSVLVVMTGNFASIKITSLTRELLAIFILYLSLSPLYVKAICWQC